MAAGEAAAWLAEHAPAGERVGVAVTGTWRAGTGEVHAVAVATEAGQAAWIDVADIGPDDDAAVATWLADPGRPKALHDANGPSLALAARGWELAGLEVDTALAAYLVQPDQRSYDLADLTLRYLGLGQPELVAADRQGRVDPAALAAALEPETLPAASRAVTV